jgi:hypothetical protein
VHTGPGEGVLTLVPSRNIREPWLRRREVTGPARRESANRSGTRGLWISSCRVGAAQRLGDSPCAFL